MTAVAVVEGLPGDLQAPLATAAAALGDSAPLGKPAGPSPVPVCRGDRLAFAGQPGAGRAFCRVNVGLVWEPWWAEGAPALQGGRPGEL